MADQRIGYSEEMVGSGHPTKADTLNRLALVEHNADGTHSKLTGVTDPWVDVRAFGAVGDGAADDTGAIQAAIDSIIEGVVFIPTGVWGVTGLTVPSRVVMQGMGSRVTELKLLDGTDADCVVSKDFSTLTGTNKWLTADGVPYAFGLRGVRINGNKAGNASGYGVRFYGKRIMADDVLIYDCPGVGWYSECAATVGQNDWTDMPESRLTLDVRNCGGDNVVFRGSHDSVIREVISCYSGGAGIKTERLAGTYDGNVNIVSAHTYGNAAANIFDALTNIEGKLTLDGDSAVFTYKGNLINQLWLLNTPGGVSFSSTAEQTLVNQVYGVVAAGSDAVTMLDIQAKHMKVGSVRAAGNSATNSTGVNVAAGSVEVGQMHITGFSGTASTGVRLAASDCRVAGKITDCTTCFDYASGSSNDVRLKIFTSSGQTSVSGTPSADDRVDIVSSGAGSPVGNTRSIKSVDFSVDTTGLKTVSLNHGLIFTPQKHDVQVSVAESTDVTDYAVDFVRISGVSSTQITFDVKVSTASVTGGAVATLVSKVDYA